MAQHRGADGHPGFEANGPTRLHDKVILAREAGSYWVIALCVASAIEGLVTQDPAFASTPANFTGAELQPAKAFVSTVTPERLRGRLSGWLAGLHQPSASRYLGLLQKQGCITRAQLDAWKKVRNQVAHGNLFEPWGTREEHEQLIALVELFHKLTALRVGFDNTNTVMTQGPGYCVQ